MKNMKDLQNNPASLPESFGTLSQTLNGLKEMGYPFDFNIKEECVVCNRTNITLSPEDFRIDKVYRFEGESNPDDESVVYAISSPEYGVKGTLVNGYGISADESVSKMVAQLQTHAAHHSFEKKTEEGVRANEATTLRPEGDRILDAPLVKMNIADFISKIHDEETWQTSDRNSMTIFKSETMRIVLIGLHKEAELKPHKANGVISVQVVEGKIDFMTSEDHVVLEKGEMLALHENIMHSVKAVSDSFFLLTLAMNKADK